jgi:hypothetical protein
LRTLESYSLKYHRNAVEICFLLFALAVHLEPGPTLPKASYAFLLNLDNRALFDFEGG